MAQGGTGDRNRQNTQVLRTVRIFSRGQRHYTILGTYSSDTYYFSVGDGQDRISDYSGGYTTADKIVFGAGIDNDNICLAQAGDDLIIDHMGNDDQIIVESGYSSTIYIC